MQGFKLFCLVVCLGVLTACGLEGETSEEPKLPQDWQSGWAVEEGFSISIDTEGYHFPTAIAFVPDPGPNPKDPLYFVTELRGTVKVVTNDRTIYTFAEDFLNSEFYEEKPSGEAEFGLAGICLEPQRGYVFVTFAYQDANHVLRNNILRFETKSEVFTTEPTNQVAFTDIFSDHPSGPSHQIGPCQVVDDLLYVSVGDGFNSPRGSQQVDSILGKILRMTLDGKPVPENPFYQDDDIKRAQNYVWAYGLRNPFSLKAVDGRIFVADNGPDIDRFLEIQEGQNYLWDGSSGSIAINAAVVIVPSVGPVQLDYYPGGLTNFPQEYAEKFFLATSGDPGILMLDYDLDQNKMLSVLKPLLKHSGDSNQSVTGVAVGPDGLYFAPLMPIEEGRSAILKITYDPENQFPYTLVTSTNPRDLLYQKGCFGCHSLSGELRGGTAGPPLDRDALIERLQARLNTEAYINSLNEIDLLDTEPYISFNKGRQKVREAEGMVRVRTWITYRIQEPRFDNQYSQMPNLGVTEKEAAIIADFLLQEKAKSSGLRRFLPVISGRHLAFAFVAGFFAAVGLWLVWRLVKFFSSKRGQAV